MERPRSEKNRDVEESEEENVLAVHYPEEARRPRIKFRDSTSPGQSAEVRKGQRENGDVFGEDDNEEEDEENEEETGEESNAIKVPTAEDNFDFRRGIYKCCVYICAFVICFTIMSGIVAVGYVFHLGS